MTFCRLFLVIGFTIAALTGNFAVGQNASSETVHRDNLRNNYRIEQEIQQFRQSPKAVQITTPQLPPVLLEDKSNQKVFKLSAVLFDGHADAVSPAELDAIAQEYIQREKVSIRDLYEMIIKIDQLFDARKVVGRAVLPVQDVENGVLHIQIIEGHIAKTMLQFKQQPLLPCPRHPQKLFETYRIYGHSFVENHFHYRNGSVLNVQKLEEEILRFNRTYRTQLIAELEPGDELGNSTLKLTAVAPQPISLGCYTDNSGRESSGKIRSGIFMNLQSLLGQDEQFYTSYEETEGTSFLTMYATVPVANFGTHFDMSYDYGTPNTIYGPFAPLNITGLSRRYRPGFRQSLYNTAQRQGELSLHMENYDSKSWFGDFLNYHEKLIGYTIGFSDTKRTAKKVQMFGVSWQLGDTRILDTGAGGVDYHYHILSANTTHIWYPNKRWTFIAKGNGQLALSQIAQSRTFQIGGMATVRGIYEGLMSAESGYLVNLEGRRLMKEFGKHRQGRIELFGFFDHGGVYYRQAVPGLHRGDFLSSLGLGFNLYYGKYVSATVGYGLPVFTESAHQIQYRRELESGSGWFTVRTQF